MKMFLEQSIWFFKASLDYKAPMRFKDWVYFPVAYVKFMYFTLKGV